MPQVYLPFGYPQLQGMEFVNVIYQGEMVRLYTVPTDPRNDAQVQQRQLFADLARMRGTAGEFVRAVARVALGSRWTGVFTQIVKADVGGWWSTALDAFDGFADLAKNAWRSASPNQASYNDVGKMFYATVRTLTNAILFYSNDVWGAEEWGEGDSAAALVWWQRNIDAYKTVQEADVISFSSGWTDEGFYWQNIDAVGDWCEFFLFGARIYIRPWVAGPSGSFDIFENGEFLVNVVTSPDNVVYIDLPYRGLHQIKLVGTTSQATIWQIWRK